MQTKMHRPACAFAQSDQQIPMIGLLMIIGMIWAATQENLSLGFWEQQRRRPACAYAQSDQRICCSLNGKYNV